MEGLIPAVIQKGTVVAVNPDAYTMEVATAVGKRRLKDMPIPSLYAHHYSGEGVHIMPEVGAEVWVAIPSEGDTRAFPLLYQPPVDTTGSMRGARPLITPGDIFIQTRDGNAIRVRRGGVIEIESTPTCRTVYLPREGRIITIAENMSIQTLAGTLDWYVGEDGELPNGDRFANLRGRFKASVAHKFSMVDLDVGTDFDQSNDTVSLRVYASGDVATAADRQLLAHLRFGSYGAELELAQGKTYNVGGIDGSGAEKVPKGVALLQKIDAVLGELSTELGHIATGIGTAGGSYTPVTIKLAELRLAIHDSLASDGGPLLSSFLKTE